MMLYMDLIAIVATLVLFHAFSHFPAVASPGCGASCLRPSTNDVLESSGNDQPAAQPGSLPPPDGPTSAPAALDSPASGSQPTLPGQPALLVGASTAPTLPADQGSSVGAARSRIFAGLFGDAQGISRHAYHAPVVTSRHQNRDGDSPYTIFCGAQNVQVQAAIGAATMIVSSILDTYLDVHAHGASPAPFTQLDVMFPFGNGIGDIAPLLDTLSTFQSGLMIQVPLPGSGSMVSPRVAVCASPTMLQDYGIANAYYDVCRNDPLIAAYHPANSAALMLCPKFFSLPARVQGRNCPVWNRFFQTFYYSYERLTVEYQSYTVLRGFIDVKLGTDEAIYVSPSPNVPNWNELLLLSNAEKDRSSALYQLYAAMFEQKCAPSPVPDQDSFNHYTWNLFRYYLGVHNAQGEPPADVAQLAAEEVEEPDDAAGPSNWQIAEPSGGTAG